LLRPEETVDVLHAVVLSGGSAFGLASMSGVADELERQGIGLDVGVARVPIVSGACLFDLMCGRADVRPDAAMGTEAVRAALDGEQESLARGNVGAGTGCTVGKVAGPLRAMKTGIGMGSRTAGELQCWAIAAVNAVGNVVDPTTGAFVAGVLSQDGLHIIPVEEALAEAASAMPLRTNTTISCVATNARLTKAQATKVAQMSADAYAHVIRPTHTTNDGDTIFVMATGDTEAQVDVVGMLATATLEDAIVDAARSAASAYGLRAACDVARA
jgi:L-aminopeptidase/D-esterase-like protein